jgi:hypothetical protein
MKKAQHHRFAAKSIVSKVMLSLMGVIGLTGLSSVKSQAAGYTYTKIAALGETAPGGAEYFFDRDIVKSCVREAGASLLVTG